MGIFDIFKGKPDIKKMKENKDVEGLIEALKHKDNLIREDAAEALGRIGDKRAVKPLIHALEDEDRGVRKLTAVALGNIKDKRAVEPLINALKDGGYGVYEDASWALGRIGDKRAVEPLINDLKDVNRGSGGRRNAAVALGNIKDKRAVEPLINALKDVSDYVRFYAAEALGRIGDKRAVEPLINALEDEDRGVRRRAASALGKIGEMEYFECDVPSGDGLCSDNNCPCPEVIIPRGTGYLYIEHSLVDFRRKYPTLKYAREAMQLKQKKMRASVLSFTGFYRLGPILVCEKGAKLRNLDLEVAAADAKFWWKTGFVPLCETPLK